MSDLPNNSRVVLDLGAKFEATGLTGYIVVIPIGGTLTATWINGQGEIVITQSGVVLYRLQGLDPGEYTRILDEVTTSAVNRASRDRGRELPNPMLIGGDRHA